MENQKTRIAVAGIGGIGGYIGGKLAHFYSDSREVEIIFISRGEQYDVIKKEGLELLTNNERINCRPHLVSCDAEAAGTLDVLILCTKNFDTVPFFNQYAACMTKDTVILTTQNTVNGFETIMPLLPAGATLLEGTIYISSNIMAPGKIHHVSGPSKFYIGKDGEHNIKGVQIAAILNAAGVETIYTDHITALLWKKFMFASPAATVTALFNLRFSEILQHPASKSLYIDLITELMQLARAKNIEIDEQTVELNCALLGKFGVSVKSSFQIDLEKNKPTEIASLLEYVVSASALLNLPARHYRDALSTLKARYHL